MTEPALVVGQSSRSRPTLGRRVSGDLIHDIPSLLSIGFLIVLIAAAVIGPMVLPYSPTKPSLGDRLMPPPGFEGGSWAHPMGTDALGRDVLTRLLYGARVTLLVSGAVVACAGLLGTVLGIVAGYYRGWREAVIMRWVDIQVAFPGLLLVLTILAVVGPSIGILILVLVLNGWMVYTRIIQAVVAGIKARPYVQASETIGCGPGRIMRRYILPGLTGSLITLGTLEFANIVLVEASLSYLGYGVQPPAASWGLMVAEGQQYISVAWWTITFPGLAIALTVLALNISATWVRSLADPEIREKSGTRRRRDR